MAMSVTTARRSAEKRFDGVVLPVLALVLLLQGADTAAAKKVGSAAAVNTAAFGAAPGAVRKAKLIGDNVVYNERIDTTGTGLVQVLFVDGSTFTVGPNSDLVIDEFVYNPEDGSGRLVASFGKGVARFVGGKLSKNKGGVNVKTPVGTIGIRGGIANLDLTRKAPLFSFVFGKELTFKGTDGTSRRLYRPGYTLQVGGGAGSGIRRTTSEDLNGIQASLTSKPGQSGGTSAPPTGAQVENSGVSRANSDLGRVGTAPPRKPRSIRGTSAQDAETTLVQLHKANRDQTVIAVPSGTTAKPEKTVDFRILAAASTFTPVWDDSRIVSSPGAQGLAGGSAGVNETVAFTHKDIAATGDRETTGTATGIAGTTIEGSKVTQFLYPGSGSGYYAQTLTNKGIAVQEVDGSKVPVVPAVVAAVDGAATGYAWGAGYFNDSFHAFAHLPNVTPGGMPSFDIEDMIVGILATGTDFGDFGDATDPVQVRTYSLLTDPTTLFSLGTDEIDGSFTPFVTEALFVNPLVSAELGTGFLWEVENSGFLIKEVDSRTLDSAHYLASSFHISGEGASQKSLISLAVGDVYLDAPEYSVLATARRGSHRIEAAQSAGLYGGAIGGVEGPDGAEFFGGNAQSFIFGNDLSGGALDAPFSDGYVERPGGFTREQTVSATLHAAALDEGAEIDVGSLTRSDRTLTGYAAGVLESTVNFHDSGAVKSPVAGMRVSPPAVALVPPGPVGPVAFSSSSPGDFSITFDSGEDSLGGVLTVRDSAGDDPEADAYTIRFGHTAGNSGYHRATFIDDDTYAARDSADGSQTYLTTDTGETLDLLPETNPKSYLVPSTLVDGADDAVLAPVAAECVCAFLEWGYWGTSMSYEDTSGVLGASEERTDNFHLGTWVAGNVTESGDLPNTGSASYAGQAVGSVVSNGAQYLAAGDFSMTVDFANRTGTAAISDFNSRSFSATLSEQAIAGGNHFSGALAGDAAGTIDTSIVGGPHSGHDGVIGGFNAADPATNWLATGIVAGEKQ